MASYDAYLRSKQQQFGDRFTPVDLDQRFVTYFENGQRIRVRLDVFDKEVTGTVSVTTGWKPCFLLMHRASDHGSVYLLGPEDVITAVQIGRTYIALAQPV